MRLEIFGLVLLRSVQDFFDASDEMCKCKLVKEEATDNDLSFDTGSNLPYYCCIDVWKL